jgi:hypothetical protein
VDAGGKLDITDSEIRGADPIRVAGNLKIRRSVFRDCPGACISGEGGDIDIAHSSFIGAAGTTAIDLIACPANPLVPITPVMDLVGNTFVGFGTAIHVGLSCDRPTSILHQTFHRNAIAVSYEGGQQHVLQNNIFSEQSTTPILGCAQPSLFAVRSDHALYLNASDGCLRDDPGVLSVDPHFGAPSSGDFRLIYGSPLVDTAPAVGDGSLDVNGAAPGLYFGAGPDYGGRETY